MTLLSINGNTSRRDFILAPTSVKDSQRRPRQRICTGAEGPAACAWLGVGERMRRAPPPCEPARSRRQVCCGAGRTRDAKWRPACGWPAGVGAAGFRHAGDGALWPALGHSQRRLSLSGIFRAFPASVVVRVAGSAGGLPGPREGGGDSRPRVVTVSPGLLRCPEFALRSLF